MAKREFVLEFEFTSTQANNNSYTRRATVKATNEQAALNVAHIIGFEQFGARFNDNCFDWRIVKTE